VQGIAVIFTGRANGVSFFSMPTRHRADFLAIGLIAALLLAAAPAARADGWPLEATLAEPGGSIDLYAPHPLPVSTQEVKDWVQRAATALTHFYGRYPVEYVTIHCMPSGGGGVQGGVEHEGDRIDIRLGPRTNHDNLVADWMMTHEMFHLSQPDVRGNYSWMSEGMADYLEPVARVRIGQITRERFWGDLVEGMPYGLPKPGDRGLDHTHTWGRTYWGGSLFWLLADIRIRQQTQNRKSVRDAARAVLDAGGDGSQTWTISQLVDAYDQGVGAPGVTVFRDLHDEMGSKPVATDLPALWKSLGVVYDKAKVTFDDAAPLAEVRKGITEMEK
jgi:hypothetical protein